MNWRYIGKRRGQKSPEEGSFVYEFSFYKIGVMRSKYTGDVVKGTESTEEAIAFAFVSEFLTFKKRESRKFGDNSDRKTIRTRNGYLV
ncbi:hypothetical protein BK122_22250 [Paenibacillus pabuli]|nr:hypothetical protein BK122_22250 [Paenibacillus pabuli]